MAVVMKKMVGVDLLTVTSTQYYFVPAATTASITSIVLNNKGTAPVNVTIIIAGITHVITLAQGQLFGMDSKFTLTATETIKVHCSVAGVCSAYISGVEAS